MIVISNGHHKFITGMAAAEANKHGLLAGFITAGYPTPAVRRLISLCRLGRSQRIRRLLQRQEELPDVAVHAHWLSELVYGISRAIGSRLPKLEDLSDYGLRCYAWQAKRLLRRLPGRIYHYRSGYGHESVAIAKRRGMIALCDHSIAHPLALDYLVRNGGLLPPPGESPAIGRLWSNVLRDLDQADYFLVNSDFVKDTFIHFGYDPERIFVLYTGIDDQFAAAVPPRNFAEATGRPLRIMFAGELGERKGGRVLLDALLRVRDMPWELECAGTIAPDMRREYGRLFADERVTVAGFLSRAELAVRMSTADVFVFPSLAEGSARVVFQAMACGCYVITTPNAGSVLQDGVGGRLIPPGSVDALEAALREAIRHPEAIAPAGRRNAELIRSQYMQQDYGQELMKIYNTLLAH
ncbi:MAG: glycosyltransferase family 4 protein [Actinomycetota bacterium]